MDTILDYINKSRSAGLSDSQIKQSLLQSGWTEVQLMPYFPGTLTVPAPAPVNLIASTPGIITANSPTNQTVWSLNSLYFTSVLFGPMASYLVVLKDIQKVGNQELAGKFKKYGLLFPVAVFIISYFLPEGTTKYLGYAAAAVLPYWFDYAYFKSWRVANPGRVKFEASILGWGFLGLIIYLIPIVIMFVVALSTTTI